MQNLKDWKPGTHRKVFLAGKPKSAGKTTFAMTAPGTKLVLQYDLGNPAIPPGVDPATIFYKSYPTIDPVFNPEGARWKKSADIGSAILKDIIAVNRGFVKGGPITIDGVEIPLPDTIVLDGITELSDIMVDFILATNNKTSPDEFDNRFFVWTDRIDKLRNIFNLIIQLPANIVLISWEDAEMKDMKATGMIKPDIGGKMDNKATGKVDAALRCYAKYQDGSVRYMVQCQPDGIRDWIGIRGAYNLPKEVDVTITANNKVGPWQKVFGNG